MALTEKFKADRNWLVNAFLFKIVILSTGLVIDAQSSLTREVKELGVRSQVST
jgi:hypothetical protein